ncbi:MAG: hypothetical protein ACI38Y_06395 [Candidatus Methanomethylophilaceae archaeon]
MTCPKCGGRCEDISHFSEWFDDEEYGPCLISYGLCQTCGFEVSNTYWLDKTDEVHQRAWMTGLEKPNDIPKVTWDVIEKIRNLIREKEEDE